MENAHQMVKPYNPVRAVQYGQLVQIAYDMYDAGQGGLTPTPPTPFPGGYTFIAWVQMRDFIIEEGDWTFYGFIAQRTSKANEFVLAIRGTGDDIEWWDDLTSMVLVPLTGFGQAGYGFNRIYQTLRVAKKAPSEALGADAHAQSVQPSGTFAEQVAAVVREHAAIVPRSGELQAEAPSAAMSIEVTGHSLGSALATLYVAENANAGLVTTPLICTFASPRVGDPTFATEFDRLGITSWRIVNEPDLVPKLPFLGFQHVEVEHVLQFRRIGRLVFGLLAFPEHVSAPARSKATTFPGMCMAPQDESRDSLTPPASDASRCGCHVLRQGWEGNCSVSAGG